MVSVQRSAPAERQKRCPLRAAALRLADPAVLAVVQLVHPPEFCPAARREAA